MSKQKIYVADLAAYNEGYLHGVWITLNRYDDASEVWGEINAMLEKSPSYGIAEEWEIHDHEGFGGIDPTMYSIEALMDIVRQIDTYGEPIVGVVVSRGWRPSDGDLEDEIRSSFAGAVAAPRDEYDWAWDHLDETGMLETLPEWVTSRMEHALVTAWFDDLENGGDIVTTRGPDGSTYIFWAA